MKVDQPLVSIITPSMNQARFIEETLRSVREQRYPNIEHIVVDGASTDGTREIVARYEGTYNLRWLSEPDNGMYEAINKGLRLAHGDILAYLNSDDRYFPWTVETVVRALTAPRAAGFVFGDMLNIDDGARMGRLLLYPTFHLERLRRTGFLGQPTVFWRREVIEGCGLFDSSLKFVADCDYWMRIGGRFPGRKLNEVLAIERNHPDAKRMAQMPTLVAELARVRARYAPPASRRIRVADQLFQALSYRRLLLRFLLARRRSGGRTTRSGGDYAATLSHATVCVNWPSAVAALVPLTGGRIKRTSVQEMVAITPVQLGSNGHHGHPHS